MTRRQSGLSEIPTRLQGPTDPDPRRGGAAGVSPRLLPAFPEGNAAAAAELKGLTAPPRFTPAPFCSLSFDPRQRERMAPGHLPSAQKMLPASQGWNGAEGLATHRQDAISLFACEPSPPPAARQSPHSRSGPLC